MSGLRVLARTRSLYWGEGPLILREINIGVRWLAGYLLRLKDVARWLRAGLISESGVGHFHVPNSRLSLWAAQVLSASVPASRSPIERVCARIARRRWEASRAIWE